MVSCDAYFKGLGDILSYLMGIFMQHGIMFDDNEALVILIRLLEHFCITRISNLSLPIPTAFISDSKVARGSHSIWRLRGDLPHAKSMRFAE